MATIRREIEIDVEPPAAGAAWARFVQWARKGHGRLTCDELACVDAVRTGLVGLRPADGGHTTVTFTVETGEGPEADRLPLQIGHDLVVFKDYVERSDPQTGTAAVVQQALVEDDDRRQHRAAKSHPGEIDESVDYAHHFPR